MDIARWTGLHKTEQLEIISYKFNVSSSHTMISVDKHFTNRQWVSIRFQGDAHKSARHWSSTWQEERSALFDVTGELVADWVRAHIGSVVANSDGDRRRAASTARGAKINTNQLL